MIVKNKTNKIQTLWIRDVLRGGSSSPAEVLPKEPKEIPSSYIVDKIRTPNFDEIFEIQGLYKSLSEKRVEPKVEDIIEEESNVIEESTSVEEFTEVMEDKFICDVCGAEFASARGLASHKNRSH